MLQNSLTLRTNAMLHMGLLDYAMNDAKTLISMDTSNSEHYMLAAAVARGKKEYQQATEYLLQALEIDPSIAGVANRELSALFDDADRERETQDARTASTPLPAPASGINHTHPPPRQSSTAARALSPAASAPHQQRRRVHR